MYDFVNFIEILNNHEFGSNSIAKAIESISDVFYIGKIEIIGEELSDNMEFVFSDELDEDGYVKYNHNDCEYRFYRRKIDYLKDDDQFEDIRLLLRLIALYHTNYLLEKKAEEAEYISLNTRLPNSHGFIRNAAKLVTTVDAKNYNAYFINIKGFGLVNKLFGQQRGDMAIKSYAQKLSTFVQEDELLGHLGGDNFVALIKRRRHEGFIKLVTMCPILIMKDEIKTKVNLIGVVGYYELKDNNEINEGMMSHTGMACQYARSMKKLVVQHTPELEELVNSVKKIESTFKAELDKGNFVVYYQPKFDIKSGKIIGVEALSRWISNGKMVPPGLFVPILERNGEIIDLDLFVLETLCKDIHNYRNMGHNIVPASCNLSRRDFENPDLEEIIINIIKKYNVKSQDIVIEVTETTNLEENERLAKFISTMHTNGIMTSIDDFGTGYSSLSVLRDFKVNEIKIDRSFINREILTNSDEIIIGSIIDMAKRLNISVICEGVETKEQADFLVKLGCNNAQGFLYSKPLPKLEFEALMQRIGTVYDK